MSVEFSEVDPAPPTEVVGDGIVPANGATKFPDMGREHLTAVGDPGEALGEAAEPAIGAVSEIASAIASAEAAEALETAAAGGEAVAVINAAASIGGSVTAVIIAVWG